MVRSRAEIVAEAEAYLAQQRQRPTNPHVAQANAMLAQRAADEEQKKQEQARLAVEQPVLSQAQENPEELGFKDRAVMSLPTEKTAKIKYLQDKFGPENVRLENDTLFYRPNAQEKWRFVDKPETTTADVADWAGPAVETVPQAVAGVAGSAAGPVAGVAAAGLAGAASTAARGEMSKALAGDPKTHGDVAMESFISGVLGAIGEGVVRAGARFLTPTGKAMGLAKEAQKDFPKEVKEGLALRKEFKVPLTAGQISESEKLISAESLQRQVGGGTSVAVKALRDRAEKLQEAGLNMAQSIAGGKSTAGASAVKALTKVRDMRLGALKEARAKEAKELIGFVDPNMQMNMEPTIKALDTLIARYSGKFQTDAGEALVKRLEKWKEMAKGRTTVHDLQLALEQFGEYGSTGDIMKDISQDTGRKVGRAVFRSLQESLDATALGGEGIGAGTQGSAAALKEFRNAYREASKRIEDADTQILSRAAYLAKGKRGTPDALIKGLARGSVYDPEDIARTLAITDAVDPEVSSQVRGAVVRRMLTAQGAPQLSGAKMYSRLSSPDAKDMLDALFKSRPDQRAKLERFLALAKKESMRPYTEGSQTAFKAAQIAGDVASAAHGPVVATVAPGILKRAMSMVSTSKTMTKLLQTQEGVDILFGLAEPKKSALRKAGETVGEFASRLLARVAEINADEDLP